MLAFSKTNYFKSISGYPCGVTLLDGNDIGTNIYIGNISMKASKKLVVSALSSLIMMMAAGSAMAAGEAPTPITEVGGKIHFSGLVTDAACTVDVNSSNQTINLGGVNPDQVAKGKGLQNESPFTIQLDKCSIDTYTTVSFAFNGQADQNDTTVLGNNAGAGGATGVGVQLKDMNGKPITITPDPTNAAKMTLVPNTNIASFSAGLMGVADVVSTGPVETETTFMVHYE